MGRLALALHLAGRDTEALTWYTLALEHDPFNADTLFNMAVSQQRLGAYMSSVCVASRHRVLCAWVDGTGGFGAPPFNCFFYRGHFHRRLIGHTTATAFLESRQCLWLPLFLPQG